jgi:nitrogen fixation protein FixH
MDAATIDTVKIDTAKSGNKWLLGVIGVYSTFALGTLAVVGFTFTQKVELVSEKHYQQGVAYQTRIENANRTAALTEPLSWRIVGNGKILEITYPASMLASGDISGAVSFVRPSSSAMDTQFVVQIDADGKQRIPLDKIQSGFWTISLELKSGGKEYFKASDVTL